MTDNTLSTSGYEFTEVLILLSIEQSSSKYCDHTAIISFASDCILIMPSCPVMDWLSFPVLFQGLAVSHTSSSKKTEIKVYWNAPHSAPNHVRFL